MTRFLPIIILIGLAARDLSAQDKRSSVDFEKQVRPILAEHCADCHGPDDQSGGLRLDARHFAFKGGDGGPVIQPLNASRSELFQRISSDDEDEQMPPDDRLSAKEIELIRKWIDSGAPWRETEYDRQAKIDPRLKHWAFQPLKKVNVHSIAPYTNPIDGFIAGRLKKLGYSLREPASRRTLIRRLTLDLTGLPPSPEEVEAFEKDQSPDAYFKLVKRLLKSPRYGERWAQHWLDVVRYADTHGFEVNTPRENSWPYRDYVIKSFNDDKPYDQFVREQIVGDALGQDAATGFLVASPVLLPGQIGKDDASKRLARQDELDEMVVGTGATFLGLSIGCARCHDHKFDPITAKDYYAMQAFFTGVDFGERQLNNADFQSRLSQAKALDPEIDRIRSELAQFVPEVFPGFSLIIDETDSSRTTFLTKENGEGVNPSGVERGYQSDTGSKNRLANISGGKYTWWNNVPGQDVMSYRPQRAGDYHLWISWGVHGSGVHTRDARYILDVDGDPNTKEDQRQIAEVDQYYPAYVTQGKSEQKPRWSGLFYAGQVSLTPESIILVRGGKTGTGITADTIVLQSAGTQPQSLDPKPLPRLREPVNFRENIERFRPTQARYLRFTALATDSKNFREPCIDELEVFSAEEQPINVALRSNGSTATSSGNYGDGTGIHQLAHLNDGKFGNSWSWISNQQGQGWVQIEFKKEYMIDRVVWGRDRLGQFKDRLAVQYKIEVSRDGQTWSEVASNSDRAPFGSPGDQASYSDRLVKQVDREAFLSLKQKLRKLEQRRTELQRPQMVYAGKFKSPEPAFVLRRGNPELKGEPVLPAFPALFGVNVDIERLDDEQARRKQLANWIASPRNPLTARVIVNRIWAHHFGRGLVDTPSDFGVQSGRPEHQQLLDWLAGELIRHQWSLKKLHELIVTSQTYQQKSDVLADRQKADAENRFFWRFETRRLEAEAIRDSMLAVSGELNLQMGGPGFNFFKSRGGLSGFPQVTEFGRNELRRMIYAHKIRMERVPVFGAFDCPDAGQAMPKRSRSTTAIQALNLFNSQFVFERASKFAERIKKETGSSDPTQWVNRAFRLALCRTPSQTELKASKAVVQQHGLESLCRALFNSNEFLFLP